MTVSGPGRADSEQHGADLDDRQGECVATYQDVTVCGTSRHEVARPNGIGMAGNRDGGGG